MLNIPFDKAPPPATVDAVVIGRNEGPRLVACLTSLQGQVRRIVYVDSGSSDGSVTRARDLGAEIIELDTSVPFTAARARNAGLALLTGDGYVQFVDGDCVVNRKWIKSARTYLTDHPKAAVVCGRRRERHPGASLYNGLCDLEWDTPIGEAKACGGDALMRLSAVKEVGGYRETLIAGEEPELCVRLRQKGWSVWRMDAEMTLHDAQMTRFSQWWRRSRRAGHAFAEGAALHGAPPERHWVKETYRALLWGAALPVGVIASGFFLPWLWLAALLYPIQYLRLWRKKGATAALFSMIGKFAEAQGALEYHVNRRRGHARELLEYKN